MIYKNLCGHEVSNLGMGCMRLPVIDGDDSRIDEAAVMDMVACAMEQGINYYDTAWGYHGGNSEAVTAKALARYPRESYYVASKWPGYDNSNFGKAAQIFEEQLRRTGLDHFDFYLAHNITESNIEHYLDDETYGTISYLVEQRDAGRIGHLGFSVHGDFNTMMRFMEAYGDHMEFCQIQLNYMDWTFQDAKAKVEYLNERNIPIIVMEPLRGGNLISFTDSQAAALDDVHPGMSAPEWAFRYVQAMPGVATVLSGMSNMGQLQQNIDIFQTDAPLTESETAALYRIADEIIAANALPCTACRYCVSHCPQELDIPLLIQLFNEHKSRATGQFIAPMRIGAMPADKRPSACIGCASCEDVCPQSLPIASTMTEFAQMLGL